MQYCGEFDNWGAVMSVSSELLCSFELLKPLDSSALKSHIKKGRNKRQNMLNSPVSAVAAPDQDGRYSNAFIARHGVRPKFLIGFLCEVSHESKQSICESLLRAWRLVIT